jgi:ELWxxDGT repeat protein
MNRSLRISSSTGIALAVILSAAATVGAAAPGHANLVRDINPGQAAPSDPDYLTDADGTLYFAATGPGGRELYRSDGTSAGTVRISIRPGAKSADPLYMTAIGSRVFFSANGGGGLGRELWVSDGTNSGTHLVADVRPGSKSSSPRALAAMGGKLYFSADGGGGLGRELWVSDGTSAGTHLVRDIRAGKKGSDPQEMVAVGNRIFFRADTSQKVPGTNQTSNALWASDGTHAGTTQIPITAGGDVWELTRVGAKLFFVSSEAPDGPFEGRVTLRVVNPGAQTSNRLTDLAECSDQVYCHYACGDSTCRFGFDLTAVGGLLYFSQTTDRLWRSDGTKAGTFKVTRLFGCDINTGAPCAKSFMDVDGTLFFIAPRYTYSGPNGEYERVSIEVWTSDGTPEGVELVKAFPPNDVRWFEKGPCPAEPEICANYLVGSSAALLGQYYFSGPEGDLWQTNGTAAGTKRACPAAEQCANGPMKYTTVEDTLYISADDGIHGRELWRFIP